MNLLTIDKMSKSYTQRMLFDEVDFSIHEGDKIGVIGINGTGKSTLLKIITGLEFPDSGTVVSGNHVRIGYLPQLPDFDDNLSILENVLLNQKAEKEYHNLEGEAISMLQKLGIMHLNLSTEKLSGGEKKRIALVRTLLTPAEILVLDEPTNHLDSEMAEWLELYLKKFQGAFVMVTHDRYFLDNVVNKIVEIDKGQVYSYKANFSQFIELKAAREDRVLATERKDKTLYKKELEWIRRGARARSTKQKAHIQRFEELRDRKTIEVDGRVEINSLSTRLGKKTIELIDIQKAYDKKILINNFSYIFLKDDRIGIIGPNGCGKSTLLNIIAGLAKADSGQIEIGTTVQLGYFSQQNELLDESLRVIDYIKDTAEYIQTIDGTVTASQMCEKFLFDSSMQYTLIERLSGGEKRRLYLLKVLMEAPNILILDEPTNDLDIQTLAILEDYLDSFGGIVITVSHDRYFLDKIATRIFAFEGNGEIKQYEGNFSDYVFMKKSEAKEVLEINKKTSSSMKTWKSKDDRPKFTYNEQREFETIDNDVANLEAELENIEKLIIEHATDFSRLNELITQKEDIELSLEEKMERWIYLHDLADKIGI
ncbi:MAG TPA: ABC-F family ATP-binding cassette domain-containing protein [Clostridiales bacterium]|nr:ABC-F family ATP-binding cassette domain-containing protein [Clostridiales bacterium]